MFCLWLDSNRGPLESEATALPTKLQPLPIDNFVYGSNLNSVFSFFWKHSVNFPRIHLFIKQNLCHLFMSHFVPINLLGLSYLHRLAGDQYFKMLRMLHYAFLILLHHLGCSCFLLLIGRTQVVLSYVLHELVYFSKHDCCEIFHSTDILFCFRSAKIN